MNNLDIYEAARSVPNEATKPFNNGSFSGTDINPMWRIKKLTELFGACGIGWYYEVISERAEEHHDTTMAIVDLNLYIKVDGEWSKPIYGTGGNQLVKTTKNGKKASDEGYKMALTDALSVACKALGIGADIYWVKDKTKYTDPGDETPAFDEFCDDCGAVIQPYTDPKGRTVSVQRWCASSRETFGRVLCPACAAKAAANENGD